MNIIEIRATAEDLSPAGYIIATNGAIWGAGQTEQAALNQYRQSTGDDDVQLHELRRGYGAGCLYIAPATQRLLDQVRDEGGAIRWKDSGSVADIEE